MARAAVKSTYALDTETIRLLGQMADRWDVPKSEVLRRAIRLAASSGGISPSGEQLRALDDLQRAVGLRPAAARTWARKAAAERRASSSRRERAPA
jgi:hypothetical protein